jgi:hypothetical protein
VTPSSSQAIDPNVTPARDTSFQPVTSGRAARQNQTESEKKARVEVQKQRARERRLKGTKLRTPIINLDSDLEPEPMFPPSKTVRFSGKKPRSEAEANGFSLVRPTKDCRVPANAIDVSVLVPESPEAVMGLPPLDPVVLADMLAEAATNVGPDRLVNVNGVAGIVHPIRPEVMRFHDVLIQQLPNSNVNSNITVSNLIDLLTDQCIYLYAPKTKQRCKI